MPDPKHERDRDPMSTTLAAAWALIISLGGTQVWFNVASALRHSVLSPVPILAGLAPVLGSVLLSHLAASRNARPLFRCLVTAIMLASMAVSIGATIEVATPVFGYTWRAILLGIVLDSASLAALWFIMDRHSEKRAAATAVEQAQAAVQAAEARAGAAESQAREAITEASGTQASLDAAAAELATLRGELQGLRSGMNKRRSSRVNNGRRTPPRNAASSPVNTAASTPVNTTAESDVDTQAAALTILAQNPEISGGELGRQLGISKSYGCRLKRELAPASAGPDAADQS